MHVEGSACGFNASPELASLGVGPVVPVGGGNSSNARSCCSPMFPQCSLMFPFPDQFPVFVNLLDPVERHLMDHAAQLDVKEKITALSKVHLV